MEAGSLQVVVDAGPFGAGRGGHSHSDTLSLVARYGAEELLVDAGTFTYVGDPGWRAWFRGSAAHNTVRVGGADQAEAAGPFGWRRLPAVRIREWSSTSESDFLDAECRYSGIVHRRRVLLLKPGLLLILDDVEGAEEALLEQFWRPGQPVARRAANVYQIGGRAGLVFPDEAAVSCALGGEHGWRSRAFGSREEAPVLCVSSRGRLPASLAAALAIDPPEGPGGLHLRTEGEERRLRYTGPPAVEARFRGTGPPEIIKC
jgi:hypothetical protein